MTPNEIIAKVSQQLEAAAIPFMIVGSVVSSAYSQPRSTNDVDIVVEPTSAQLDHWLTLVGGDFYVSADAARDALRQRNMFNIIHLSSGWKVDLIVRKDRPFSREEFARKRTANLSGNALPVASAEDTILAKLEWNLITPSERQVQDALGVAISQWRQLDLPYLRKWAPELGVADKLEEVLQAAEKGSQPPTK